MSARVISCRIPLITARVMSGGGFRIVAIEIGEEMRLGGCFCCESGRRKKLPRDKIATQRMRCEPQNNLVHHGGNLAARWFGRRTSAEAVICESNAHRNSYFFQFHYIH